MTRWPASPPGSVALVALVAGGCSSATPTPSASAGTGLLPQPAPPEHLEVAPEEDRVDLAAPTFSDPTTIDNPYFPVSRQESVLLVGTVDDMEFRTEVTLLPVTRVLDWQGQRVETAISQYVAFLDGRLHEVAYDLYAQADDGSVWYFGEDVFNFADGAIVDTHGTWIAGGDGPVAMIMPANPQVGDVYRPENIPGFVFDGSTEEKRFAPGYGEFYTAADGEVEALALAVPTDAAADSEPEPLATMATEVHELLAALDEGASNAAAGSLDRLRAARDAYRADAMPALLGPIVDDALERLSAAVAEGDDAATGQAAIDLGRLILDLQLRYRPTAEVETGRFGLWLAQLQLDAAAEDAMSLNGDFLALDYVRERFFSTLDPAKTADLNLDMEELLSAIGDEDFVAASEIAATMQEALAELSPRT